MAVGVAQIRGVVAAHLPDLRIDSVAPLGQGLDHVAYEVNGELIVRFGRESDPERLDREARLLAAVAAVAPLPVPRPVFTAAEWGCMAYAKLPGTPLLHLPRPHGPSVGAKLGEFLAALHAIPVARMAELAGTDDYPLIEWRREAAESYSAVADRIPPAHRAPIEAFLAAPPPPEPTALLFSHNDLGIEHVLADPATGALTGVIDWSDAALTDPARDFGLIHRDLGPGALTAAIGAYDNVPDEFAARAEFHARCGVLADLAYGIEMGRNEYADKSLAAMRWLFPG